MRGPPGADYPLVTRQSFLDGTGRVQLYRMESTTVHTTGKPKRRRGLTGQTYKHASKESDRLGAEFRVQLRNYCGPTRSIGLECMAAFNHSEAEMAIQPDVAHNAKSSNVVGDLPQTSASLNSPSQPR
ncbi:hypothetical protein PCH_Pc24g02620 [Penicillium rubens Wisconsin 54-1255]|uniref:Uncharacterized protein n=1 Tax=Penicillium rubens (strain ATCC 28089 / DSM 1075 / NRRL 1951 / Wisconsin 54-1255) TaxID=500485 RepID=B6HX36_PENRW|nr:hypothetical protein PCH_Pc24g02620 [Penicillium rubens Wisconsin 54-1255]